MRHPYRVACCGAKARVVERDTKEREGAFEYCREDDAWKLMLLVERLRAVVSDMLDYRDVHACS